MRLRNCKVFTTLEDLPAWNFHKVERESDLRFLLDLNDYNDIKISLGDSESLKLAQNWQNLYFEYIDTFGVSEKYKDRVTLRKEIAILEAELTLGGDPIKKTWLNIKNRELNELDEDNDNSKSVTFEEEIVMLMKWSGVHIDSKKVSSLRYFTLRKMFNEEMKSLKFKEMMSEHGR